MLQWYNATMLQWYNAAMVQCYNAAMLQWYNAAMLQWYNLSDLTKVGRMLQPVRLSNFGWTCLNNEAGRINPTSFSWADAIILKS